MSGIPCPKVKVYRNPRILASICWAPHCMGCGVVQEGQVVGAHSNRLEDGKGTGVKSHDVVAALCPTCHAFVDGKGDLESRHVFFLQAVYRTVLWMLRERILEVSPI